MKYDSRSCTVTTNWEWGQNGTTPITTTTERKSVVTSQRWKYIAMYDTWAKDGALQYEGTNFVETVAPQSPGGSSQDGAIITTNGSGMADVTTTSGGDPIYIWGAVGTTDNASPSISYDDGTYAGTLYLDSVSGSPSPPSHNGSYNGDTATTSTSGTAYYSGDVPLKGSGTGSRPSNWSWSTLVSSKQTNPSDIYAETIPLAIVGHDEWNQFTLRINEFRKYKLGEGNQFTFTSATSGANVWSLYNQAVSAISPMATVDQSGGYYSKLVNLKTALNSIV
jgi:hypothetical protein